MSDPKVSVLMPVYNGEKYLNEAIDSILDQTFTNFEFLIINDGSTDKTHEILESYNDQRILVVNQENMGLTKSLNKGLALARGEYIARMDCDDISLPKRFEMQVALMDRKSHVGVCGTWVKTIGESGGNVWDYPEEMEVIKSRLLFHSVLAHPSVMMRRKFLEQNGLHYNETLRQSQDYDLWVRCAHFFSLTNLPEVLMHYRLHPEQVGKRFAENQEKGASLVQKEQLENLGISADPSEFIIHKCLGCYDFEGNKEFVEKSEAWLLKLRDANSRINYFPSFAFEQLLADFWYRVCRAAANLGFWVWMKFQRSKLSEASNLKLQQKIRFFVACGIRHTPVNV